MAATLHRFLMKISAIPSELQGRPNPDRHHPRDACHHGIREYRHSWYGVFPIQPGAASRKR